MEKLTQVQGGTICILGSSYLASAWRVVGGRVEGGTWGRREESRTRETDDERLVSRKLYSGEMKESENNEALQKLLCKNTLVLVFSEPHVKQPNSMAATSNGWRLRELRRGRCWSVTSSHSWSEHLSSEIWLSSRCSTPKGMEIPQVRLIWGQHSGSRPRGAVEGPNDV